jgi:hypothetical protein
MPRHPFFFRFFLLAPLLLAAPALPAQGQSGTREVMADAMVKMMDAMGMFKPPSGGSMPSNPMSMGSPFGGPGGWMPGGGPGMPWGSPPFGDPSRVMGWGEDMMQGFSPGASPLEGVWEGRSGELVIVQGNRFRIYSGTSGYVDGYVHAQDGRLAMYTPGEEEARPFEYAESGGRLVLRDAAGEVYMYRRLRLDDPGLGAAPPAYDR